MVSSGGENLEIYNIPIQFRRAVKFVYVCKPPTSLTNPSTPIKVHSVISYGYKHNYDAAYLVGTEVGSDTMRAERELYLRREEILWVEVLVVGGGWEGGARRGTVSRSAVTKQVEWVKCA